jgi:hypothetical protein
VTEELKQMWKVWNIILAAEVALPGWMSSESENFIMFKPQFRS